MEYLIKDLSRLTGVKSGTIRKWQERYNLFSPKRAQNGYWYYSDEDYTILSNVVKFLRNGDKISNVTSMDKELLKTYNNTSKFSEKEYQTIKYISQSNYSVIENMLEDELINSGNQKFYEDIVRKLLVLVGEAWEYGYISVSEEHEFSRWLHGYLMNKVPEKVMNKDPEYLVVVFPGDLHELGALLHYLLLLEKGINAKFVGTLPVDHVLIELKKTSYKTVSFSLTLPQTQKKINSVKKTILRRTNVQDVLFGGRGYSISMERTGEIK